MPSFIVITSIRMTIKLGKRSLQTKAAATQGTTTVCRAGRAIRLFKASLPGRLDIWFSCTTVVVTNHMTDDSIYECELSPLENLSGPLQKTILTPDRYRMRITKKDPCIVSFIDCLLEKGERQARRITGRKDNRPPATNLRPLMRMAPSHREAIEAIAIGVNSLKHDIYMAQSLRESQS